VAEFMGMLNVRDGTIGAIDGSLVRLDHAKASLWGCWSGSATPSLGQAAFLAVHPQKIRLQESDSASLATPSNDVRGQIRSATYKGAETEVTVDTDIGPFVAALAQTLPSSGTLRTLAWRPQDCAVGPSSAAV
jgi:ABC-type Fe3+/spermidine/putrescine transport system ATPase subunit